MSPGSKRARILLWLAAGGTAYIVAQISAWVYVLLKYAPSGEEHSRFITMVVGESIVAFLVLAMVCGLLLKQLIREIAYSRLLEQIESNLAHSLKTPLTAISLASETIEDESTKNKILRNATILRHRIDTALSLLQQYSHKPVETFNLYGLLDEEIKTLQAIFPEKKIIVKRPEEAIAVKGNLLLARFLFENLLINAIKHSPPDEFVTVHINSEPKNSSSAVLITIKNRISVASGSGGVGLKLSREVARWMKWEFRYQREGDFFVASVRMKREKEW